MSEVKDGISLQPGDQVEFVLVTNQRTGKSSACNVTKVRLVSLCTRICITLYGGAEYRPYLNYCTSFYIISNSLWTGFRQHIKIQFTHHKTDSPCPL